MATRRTRAKPTAAGAAGHTDPTAPLDSKALLAAATPVLAQLAADLLARAKGSPAVTAALVARHEGEQKARRTADPFAVWQTNLVDQVAAAWLLSCVFVRTLEDRGLLPQARLAGPGAADSQRLFFDLSPSLAERDYLLTVFRELSRFPAARDLFDAKHNPVWLLTPSAEAAKALLALFRLPSAESPTFRFGQPDTRFLGDLYQDLNEAVQKRYALLQTPRFVESFILDRTLEPAIVRFGLDETTVIDPTCGSGHFLLGAFDRLFDHRLRAEPGLGVREAARKALDAVYGADINPYAVAIARFRLTLAYLEKAGFARLMDAPALPLHLVVADSLLHNAQLEQKSFLELDGQVAAAWAGEELALEDEKAAREVLHRRYAAVVGNPPYITVKDAVLRERYREMYSSAFRSYSLGVPFTERFFQLAREGGRVGMITANSFMKREFGSKLIEAYLPTVNLDLIVNTAGAYIPGHGTPTVLLFGSSEAPRGTDVLAVLAKRGEPSTPKDAEQGLVWRSIAERWGEVGFENDYVSVAQVERTTLVKHPWSLRGGGAAELKELIEGRAVDKLVDRVLAIGRSTHTGEDGVFFMSEEGARRRGIETSCFVPLVKGEQVRDWAISPDEVCYFPYDLLTAQARAPRPGPEAQHYWSYRAILKDRQDFGQKIEDRGLNWFEHSMFFPERYVRPLSISFAFVATHNHFALDRGGKVFNRTAPIIKLPETASEDDHLALLAYLNSSTACFWMKQVIHKKSSASQKHHADPARASYEFASTALQELPIVNYDGRRMSSIARTLTTVCELRAAWLSGETFRARAPEILWTQAGLLECFASGWLAFDRATAQAAYLQEEIDWLVYAAAGLIDIVDSSSIGPLDIAAPLGTRPFERAQGYDAGVSDRVRNQASTIRAVVDMPPHWVARLPLLEKDGVRLIESREHKRMWRETEKNVDQVDYRTSLPGVWLKEMVVQLAEGHGAAKLEVITPRAVALAIDEGRWPGAMAAISDYLSNEPGVLVAGLIANCACPYLAAYRYTDAGVEKRSIWERTWDLQRREDVGERVDDIPVPPKYDSEDFRDPITWGLRGKLDVPKERFISYPGCESDQDGEPVYGWAGWNYLQQAQALAALYQKRKTEEAWEKDRLTPMLAGLLELLPWIKQWHNEPSDDYAGMRLGDFFASFLEAECISLGLTRDDLRNWRPESRKRGKAAPKAKKPGKEAAGEPAGAATADPAPDE